MVRGLEFHSLIASVFSDVNGLNLSEQLQVCCPRCQERDGLSEPDGKFNLEINTEKRVFRCWKCDDPPYSGSLGRLIKENGSRLDYEVYKSYSGSYYDDWNREDAEEVEEIRVKLPYEFISFKDMDFKNPEHFKAYSYLINKRKFSRDIILKFGLGFCVSGKYAERIIIPSYDENGNVNYFVARYFGTVKKTKPYDNPKANKSIIIFNDAFINWDMTVFLVEGGFEMLSFPINTIPLLGKTPSSTLLLKIKEHKPNIVIILDLDAYKNSLDLFYLIRTIYVGCEERVKLIKLPSNEDFDEVRKNYGSERMVELLRTARELIVDDYFIKKLVTTNERTNNRTGSHSKYFERK